MRGNHANDTRLGPILFRYLQGGGIPQQGSQHADRLRDHWAKPRNPLHRLQHAERNAICNAARAGTATEGCTIFVEIMPCMDCARAVVQAGIIEVVVSAERMAQYSSEYYNEHFGMVEVLFGEARIRVRRV
jgi:deoxycytidylate deaminase